jgi:ParB family chromosome partitioning protein
LEKNNPMKKEAPSRLGRGLSALIPPSARPIAAPLPSSPSPGKPAGTAVSPDDTPGSDRVQEVPIAAIVPNTFQPRTQFDDDALKDLAASVAAHGVLQPIMVRASGRGRYEIIAGERRFRAAERAGLTRIPVIQFHLTQTELAKQIGKGLSTISNSLRLLDLPEEIQDSITQSLISSEHGKVLLSVPQREKQFSLWRQVIDNQLSVKALYALMEYEGVVTATRKRSSSPQKDIHWQALEDQFRTALSMRIELRPGRTGRGSLTIEFSNDEEIEDLLAKLNAL